MSLGIIGSKKVQFHLLELFGWLWLLGELFVEFNNLHNPYSMVLIEVFIFCGWYLHSFSEQWKERKMKSLFTWIYFCENNRMEKIHQKLHTKSLYLYKIQDYSNRKESRNSLIMVWQKKPVTIQQIVIWSLCGYLLFYLQ